MGRMLPRQGRCVALECPMISVPTQPGIVDESLATKPASGAQRSHPPPPPPLPELGAPAQDSCLGSGSSAVVSYCFVATPRKGSTVCPAWTARCSQSSMAPRPHLGAGHGGFLRHHLHGRQFGAQVRCRLLALLAQRSVALARSCATATCSRVRSSSVESGTVALVSRSSHLFRSRYHHVERCVLVRRSRPSRYSAECPGAAASGPADGPVEF